MNDTHESVYKQTFDEKRQLIHNSSLNWRIFVTRICDGKANAQRSFECKKFVSSKTIPTTFLLKSLVHWPDLQTSFILDERRVFALSYLSVLIIGDPHIVWQWSQLARCYYSHKLFFRTTWFLDPVTFTPQLSVGWMSILKVGFLYVISSF